MASQAPLITLPIKLEQPTSSTLLTTLHYVFPVFLLFFFIIFLATWSVYTSETTDPTKESILFARRKSSISKPNVASGHELRKIPNKPLLSSFARSMFNWALVGLTLTYILDAANLILHALAKKGWWAGQDTVIYTTSLIFLSITFLASQLESKYYPVMPHATSWFMILCAEITILIEDSSLHTRFSEWDKWQIALATVAGFRIVWLAGMVVVWFLLYAREKRKRIQLESDSGTSSETSSLLGSDDSNVEYGTTPPQQSNGAAAAPRSPGWARRDKNPEGSWWEYLKGYKMLFPYLWPSKDRKLQFTMWICILIVIIQRWINVKVPDQLGRITKILGNDKAEERRIPWFDIFLYLVFRFLQGNMGLLGGIRSILWIPISQYSYRSISQAAFEHVHSLSLDFHLGKKTGEVLSALSKGAAINNFLEMVTFQVLPMLLDLGVAVVYFSTNYDAYYALIIIIVTGAYLYVTVRMARWRSDIRRTMVNKSREEDAVKNDSMIAYETVKYFNAETYEFNRYREAVSGFQNAEYRVLTSLNIMNVTQNLIFSLGLITACYLSAYQVTTGQADVGKFVTLLTYLAQLQGPLNFFGTFYRSIQSSMINSERMLELFREKPTVIDEDHAKRLSQCDGHIAFDNVHFAYDERKPALRGLCFEAAPGTTTAFVGESGGGKTTILRLIFRFYNASSGAVKIDGRDVRDFTIESLRENIGVVPQDTVLFNETLMYNLKYANPDATDQDVYRACQAASIHEKILTFPDGYNTKVGERGLRLSGGEKQRVAIARTIIKNPKIILLDEATASLDTETEQHIQSALKELTAGRTTLVIAHRLSTIRDANQIVVVVNGRVAEVGTHDELLALRGKYSSMWYRQIRAEEKMKKLQAVHDDDPYSGENTPGTRTPLIMVSDMELEDHPGPVIGTSGVPIPPSGAAEGPNSGVGSDFPPRSL
ncbi:hypothetical protein H072_1159 [Dactylellina haptotyla CBS 200.50]|uniref:ABC transporter domain-containing protein n=1 Tax=Dactylellina haptotyla (strain CBS 200.50) TaxID=1284197 RepID=S8CAY6_DACHA|nr:hypothetical protein H072_1159 [Dactylellina haptotyla CBS 200.50]